MTKCIVFIFIFLLNIHIFSENNLAPNSAELNVKDYAEKMHKEAIELLNDSISIESIENAIAKYYEALKVYKTIDSQKAEVLRYTISILSQTKKFIDTKEESFKEPEEGIILVVGGTGFIGQSFLEHKLIEERAKKQVAQDINHGLIKVDHKRHITGITFQYNIKIVSVSSGTKKDKMPLLVQDGIDNGEIEIVSADVTEEGWIDDITNRYPQGIKEIINLSGQSNVTLSFKNPLETFKVNLGGALNIARLARLFKAGSFHLSSILVYKNRKVNADHINNNIDPLSSPYAESKFLSEIIFKIVAPYPIIYRTTNVFGIGDIKRVIPIFISKILDSNPIEIFDSAIEIDFVYVKHIVNSISKIMQKNLYGTGVYTSGRKYNLVNVAKLIAYHLDKSLDIIMKDGSKVSYAKEELIKFEKQLSVRNDISMSIKDMILDLAHEEYWNNISKANRPLSYIELARMAKKTRKKFNLNRLDYLMYIKSHSLEHLHSLGEKLKPYCDFLIDVYNDEKAGFFITLKLEDLLFQVNSEKLDNLVFPLIGSSS